MPHRATAPTLAEIQAVLTRIPPVDWAPFEALFRDEQRWPDRPDEGDLGWVGDPGDP